MQNAKCRMQNAKLKISHTTPFLVRSREMWCIARNFFPSTKNVESDFRQMVARQTRNPLAQFT